jgi:hypothetical protein
MKRLLAYLLLFPAAACTGGERANSGQCPAGETCSPKTPNGLHFIGNQLADDLNLVGPSPTAIGGTQDIALQYDPGDGVLVPLDLPFTADDMGGAGVKVVSTSGSVVSVTGKGSFTNYLRILDKADGTLFDRKQLTGAALDTVDLLPLNLERVPAHAQLAFAPGDFDIAIGLFGQVQESGGPAEERIVDSSMTLVLAGATKTAWDTLHNTGATPGTRTLTVTAGDKPALSIDVVVVATADQVAPLDAPQKLVTGVAADVCFTATSGTRTVVGLPWTFTVDGVSEAAATFAPNCITVTTQKTSGTVSINGAAGGQMATLVLNVGAMAREQVRPLRVHPTTAGERAAM